MAKVDRALHGTLKLPNGVETLEMLDGRLYYSADNWQTIYLARLGKVSKVPDNRANLIRFLAVSQASWQGDAF
jgi:hypothetical protein